MIDQMTDSRVDEELEGYEDETVGIQEYSISSYSIAYDVAGIVRRLEKGDIEIPKFQRNFVWSETHSSRFIESLLLGLPVPSIFLYRKYGSEKYLVVDGHQRLKSLQFFYEGKFETGKVFALRGLRTDFNRCTYNDLRSFYRRRLDNSIIHAIVIRQEQFDDNGTSQFLVFERLNTTAVPLTSQEIRSGIYGGKFDKLLIDLNMNADWRELFGKVNKRKRDEELILRFLALYFRSDEYAPSMKAFLNQFMKCNQNLRTCSEDQIRPLFENTVAVIRNKIGPKAFKPASNVNAALLDAVMVGVARRLAAGAIQSDDIRAEYKSLFDKGAFQKSITDHTSDAEKVKQRIQLATEAFSDVE